MLPFDLKAERFFVEVDTRYAGCGASHADSKTVVNADCDLAAGHMHGNVAVAETYAVRYGGGRAAARTGREGVASAALPDLDLYVTAVDDFEELHIGAIGEGWVHFDKSAIFVCLLSGDFVLHQYAMRVADVGDIDGLRFAVES